MTDSHKKGIFVLEYLRSIGLDWETVLEAVCDENLENSYEIIARNPTITKYEFVEQAGIEYDEEETQIRAFLCHLQMHPYFIEQAMDEENYEKTLEIMETQPHIRREEFMKVMRFTDQYKGEFTND